MSREGERRVMHGKTEEGDGSCMGKLRNGRKRIEDEVSTRYGKMEEWGAKDRG